MLGSNLVEKWLVSWTREGRDLTKGWRWASIYTETRSVGGVIGRDNGAAGITRFVYFRQKVQGGGAGLGVEE